MSPCVVTCVCQHAHCLRGVRLTGAGDLTLEGQYDGIATEIDSDCRPHPPPLGGEGIKCVLVAVLRSHRASSTNRHRSVESRWPASTPSPSLSPLSPLSSSSCRFCCCCFQRNRRRCISPRGGIASSNSRPAYGYVIIF